jgi:hypothetical protein
MGVYYGKQFEIVIAQLKPILLRRAPGFCDIVGNIFELLQIVTRTANVRFQIKLNGVIE